MTIESENTWMSPSPGIVSLVSEMTAYADESFRPGGRYLLAIVVAEKPEGAARQILRAQEKRFKKRFHFNDLTAAQRSTAMSLIGGIESLRSQVFEHRLQPGEQRMDARAVVLAAAVIALQEQGVSNLLLDHFQGAEKIDGAVIRRAREQRRDATLHYAHAYYTAEPMLWVADAVAFNAGVKHPQPFPAWHQGTLRV